MAHNERSKNALEYLSKHNVEKIVGEMVNSLAHSDRELNPVVYMIKYLSNLLTEEEREKNGVRVDGPFPLKYERKSKKDLEILENKVKGSKEHVIQLKSDFDKEDLLTETEEKALNVTDSHNQKLIDLNGGIIVKYFNLNNKAALIRCMLDVSGTQYTNEVIDFEEWKNIDKPVDIFEFGFLPVVLISGRSFSQTASIEIMLAKKLGFLGSNLEEEYEILNILSSREDILPSFYKITFPKNDEEHAKYDIYFNEVVNEILPWMLPIYEKKVKNRKGKFLVGNTISLADIYLAYFTTLLTHSSRIERMIDVVNKHCPMLMEYASDLKKIYLKEYFETGSYIKEAIL